MTDQHDWRGPVGSAWARSWRITDLAFSDLTMKLNAAVLSHAPQSGGAAVDIGCGAGETSIAMATARPDMTVTGIDLSSALTNVARERGAALPNLSFETGDVRAALSHHAPVSLFLSRHGVMFFDDPVAAFANLRASATDSGRLVFSCFRSADENPIFPQSVEAVTGSLPPESDMGPGPFGFANRDRVTAILTEAGWNNVRAEAVDYRHRIGEGPDAMAAALIYFQNIGPVATTLRAMTAPDREAALGRIAALCEAHSQAGAIDFSGAAWLWSATASQGCA